MRAVRVTLAVALLALAGCDADVVLGRYFPAEAGDAGEVDAGERDAGASDAGGEIDGGAIANLVLRFVGEFVTDIDAGSFPLVFEVRNEGDAGVAGLTLSLVAPPEVEILSFPGCALDGGTAACNATALAPFATTTFTALVRFPTTPRWIDLPVSVTTTTAEARLDDNVLLQPLALTPSGVQPLPVPAPAIVDLTYCVGSNLMTFAECVPGSRARDTLVLAADGRLGLLRDGGAILPDGGLSNIDLSRGFWVQSNDTQNLAFRLTRPDGGTGAGYIGGSVSATCFEGTANNALQVPHGVAWQGCLR